MNCDASNMSSFSVSYNNNNTKNNDNNKDNDANKNNSASNNNGDTGKSDNNNNNNASTVNEGSDDKAKVIKFDRILCDVPCRLVLFIFSLLLLIVGFIFFIHTFFMNK